MAAFLLAEDLTGAIAMFHPFQSNWYVNIHVEAFVMQLKPNLWMTVCAIAGTVDLVEMSANHIHIVTKGIAVRPKLFP
jgi:hypothetical protein